jgi:aspartokinase/homoserine dehydrogenase 1
MWREIYRTDTPTKEILKDTLRINLRVIALSNSRKMYLKMDFIKKLAFLLETGDPADKEQFISNVKQLNLRNSIFVDITNESVSKPMNTI